MKSKLSGTLLGLIIVSWPLYQLSQLPELFLPSIQIRLYLFDFLVISLLLLNIKDVKKHFLEHKLSKALILFFLASLLSLLTSQIASPNLSLSQIITSSLYPVRFFAYSLLLIISIKPKQKYIKLFTYSLYIVILVGLIQYVVFPDLRLLKYLGFDDHYYRLTAPFLDPNYTGAVLVFSFFFLLSQLKQKLFLFLPIIALVLTFSRSSYLAFVLALVFLGIIKRKYRNLIIISILSLPLLITISPKPFGEGVNLLRTYSIRSRVDDLFRAEDLIKKNPLTGLGFNTLGVLSNTSITSRASSGISNSYAFILSTTGIIGFLSWTYLLYQSYLLIKPSKEILAGFLSLAIHALSNNTLFYAPILIMIFISLSFFSVYKRR